MDTLGLDIDHAPEDHHPKAKYVKLRSPKQQQKTITIATSRLKKFKMEAPGDTKSVNPEISSPESSRSLTWSDANITMAYHQRKLDTLLTSDPDTKSLEIHLLGQLLWTTVFLSHDTNDQR